MTGPAGAAGRMVMATLAHAAGELVRVGISAVRPGWDADQVRPA
jgi:hypothetical protein